MNQTNKILKRTEIGLFNDNKSNGRIISEEDQMRLLFEKNPKVGFEKMYRAYYSRLCNQALRMVHSKSIAEDIVVDVFTTFWQQEIHSKIEISYVAYLYKAVKNRSINAIKAEFSTINTVQIDDQIDLADSNSNSENPEQILQYQELSQKIDTLINNLPPQARKAFMLSRLDGKKYSEIAAELNISQSAVERLLSRALTRLKDVLKNDWVLALAIIAQL